MNIHSTRLHEDIINGSHDPPNFDYALYTISIFVNASVYWIFLLKLKKKCIQCK